MQPGGCCSQVDTQAIALAQATLKPPLKWAGGKRWLLPHLAPLWKTHRQKRLIEPFCGGLAVAISFQPNEALLNDIIPHLINFYHQLQSGLTVALRMENQAELYYRHRAKFNGLINEGNADSKEAAELFYYLNRTGYNGLCRFNASGEFNVPFGKYKHIKYMTDFTEYQKMFSRWHFSTEDFESLHLETSDFIYADPPYDVEFTHYGQENFQWDDQVRLAQWLSRHSGPIILSNQATPRILELYKSTGFEIRTLPAPRRISCTGDRTPAQEVLATKNL